MDVECLQAVESDGTNAAERREATAPDGRRHQRAKGSARMNDAPLSVHWECGHADCRPTEADVRGLTWWRLRTGSVRKASPPSGRPPEVLLARGLRIPIPGVGQNGLWPVPPGASDPIRRPLLTTSPRVDDHKPEYALARSALASYQAPTGRSLLPNLPLALLL